MFKKLIDSIICFFIILILGTLIITLINYFNILQNNIISGIRFTLPMLAIIISGYKLGKASEKNGYLEGLKLGGIIILVFMFFVLLLDKLSFKNILYYLILLLTAVVSSMIGINRRKVKV